MRDLQERLAVLMGDDALPTAGDADKTRDGSSRADSANKQPRLRRTGPTATVPGG
jgi:hypothetical protein